MTELPTSIAQLTSPIQLLAFVLVTAIFALVAIVRSVRKSPQLARHPSLLVIVAGVISLPAVFYVFMITDKHPPTEAAGHQMQANPNPNSPSTVKRPDTVVAEHTVSIPGLAPIHMPGTTEKIKTTASGHNNEDPPSFPCANAKEDDEKAICADPELRRADGALGKVYRATLAALPATERTLLIRSQRTWITDRRFRCGAHVECLQEAVQLRTSELAQISH